MEMKRNTLPQTPRDVMRFGFIQRIICYAILKIVAVFQFWKYPVKACGDVEKMSFKDKIYWLYKTTHPIQRAQRGSNLEAYFEKQRRNKIRIPDGFHPHVETTVSAVGDLIGHPFLKDSSELYTEVEHAVFDAHITMANLECVLMEYDKPFEFTFKKGPPLYYSDKEFEIIKGTNGKKFSFFAAACNHSLDLGERGIDSTIGKLEKEGIAYHGINKTEEQAGKATVLESSGIRIGVISHTFGLNANTVPPGRPNIVNYTNLNDDITKIDLNQIVNQIKDCRQRAADFIIAHLHWGMEHEFYPTPEQVKLAHHLAEIGIDLIIGHHPHVVQPFEFFTPKRDPQRYVPIYYSLGNLINSFSADYLCCSYAIKITVAKGKLGENGPERTFVTEAEYSSIKQVLDEEENKIFLTEAIKYHP